MKGWACVKFTIIDHNLGLDTRCFYDSSAFERNKFAFQLDNNDVLVLGIATLIQDK